MGCCNSTGNVSSALDKAIRRVGERSGPLQGAGRYHKISGRCLADDYVVSSVVLGHGANGQVYRAKSKTTGAFVAVKTLNLSGLSRKTMNRLVKELEVFFSIDHPHAVRLLDVYESEEGLYLVMEYLSGGELFDRQQQQQTFTEAAAADAMKQMLSVVGYIHGLGIAHRDLKLHNFVYETKNGTHLKLIDFGTSKFVKVGAMCSRLGTPGYMAPEVADENEIYTNKCDVWSLGVILFILLVGYMPFGGDMSRQLQMMRNIDPMTYGPKERWARISPPAHALVKKMLSPNPVTRPSPRELLQNDWILQQSQQPLPMLSITAVLPFQEFSQAPRLRRACLQLMASSVPCEQINDLRQAFLILDKTGMGKVSFSDLRSAVEHVLTEAVDRERIIHTYDSEHAGVDENETLGYSEFLAATVAKSTILESNALAETFRRFDVENKGYITRESILHIMGITQSSVDSSSKSARSQSTKEAPTDRITLEEFEEYALHSSKDSMTTWDNVQCRGGHAI